MSIKAKIEIVDIYNQVISRRHALNSYCLFSAKFTCSVLTTEYCSSSNLGTSKLNEH